MNALHLAAMVAVVWAVATPAEAYIGPGAGLGALGALLGVLVAIVMSVGVIVTWPIRMLLRRLRARRAPPAAADGAAGTQKPG